MAVKRVVPTANQPTGSSLGTADTQRGPSQVIWGGPDSPNAWVPSMIENFVSGMFFEDDFNPAANYPGGSYTGGFGRWTLFSTANGAITDAGIVGGAIQLAASTTAHQGVQLTSSAGAYRIVDGSGNLQGRLAFECRVSVTTGSYANSTQDTFVGLSDNGTGATALISNTGGTLSTTPNLIGFHKRGGTTNAADWNFVFQLASGTAVYPTGLQALINTAKGVNPSAGTYYKLGFVFDPGVSLVTKAITTAASANQTVGNKARPMLQVYVDGVVNATFLINTDITGATFPTGIMGPAFAFLQQSTTASIGSDIDWLRVAQNAIA